MTAQHLESLNSQLEPEPLSQGYSGPETYAAGGNFATHDGALSGGIWSYQGTLSSRNPGHNHQLWIVVQGNATIEIDNTTIKAKTGDVVLLEAPYPEKIVHTSNDFKAVWVVAPARRQL